jgi:glycosyltransferase involved in cell wall biosynthesis
MPPSAADGRPLRVLVNGVAARVGGGATYLIGQAGALAQTDGVELTVHVTGDIADRLPAGRTLRVVRQPRRSLLARLIWEQTVLAREARAHDVVWATGNFALLLCPRPQLLTAQNIAYFERPAPGSPRAPVTARVLQVLQRPLAHASVRRATHVVAVSDAMAHAIGGAARGKVTAIPNACPDLQPDVAVQPPLRDYALAVAHDLAHKDWDRLVDGVARDDGLPPLVIVGECTAERRAQLLRGVPEGRLVLQGTVWAPGELAALYRAARCVVVHSHLESFGLTACEALRLGCAVAASDIPAHREVCRDAAYLYDPGSVDALREAVRLAAAGRPRAAASWTWPHTWAEGAIELRAILRRIACAS